MCDSVVVAHPGAPVWLAKNSDREPDEPQVVEIVAAVDRGGAAIVSRPVWMTGIEMGVNERGVAVANEAVFTRVPVAAAGVSSMELQRLALQRSASAAEAVEVIVDLLGRSPQGGVMALGDRRFRYHGAMILADPREAWIIETAGELWALQRARGVRAISNALTIGADFDRVHPGAYAYARSRGLCRSAADFSFARAFGAPALGRLAGAADRRRCAGGLTDILRASDRLGVAGLALVLRDHDGLTPAAGLRMRMPCAHASYLPTRSHGQTTGSMIVRLAAGERPAIWITGTSSPCLSVFKPLSFETDPAALGPPPAIEPDRASLWWQHERLHRAVIVDYEARAAAIAVERAVLEDRALAIDPGDPAAIAAIWGAHRQAIPRWTALAGAVGRPGRGPFARYWTAKAAAAGSG